MFVTERFELLPETVDKINYMKPEFGYNGFGEFVFYRTYSRIKENGKNENWNEVVIRVIQGVMSIRKNHYIKNFIPWDEDFWQTYAHHMAISMFKMEWLPPGRGLWAMGTEFVYERGSMALNNCGLSVIKNDTFANDCAWIMDALMCGVGVGFLPERDDPLSEYPKNQNTKEYVIPDTREGWCESVKLLIEFYTKNTDFPVFNYSKIRGPGLPIKGFGGISSGPQPLIELHGKLHDYFESHYFDNDYDIVRLKADVANAIGCCVVAGNVRRSAQLAAGEIDDQTFLDLKDYSKFPERASIGWMSNNSVFLDRDEDFEKLSEIAKRVIANGEPGYINRMNLPYGRIGKNDKLKPDKAIGFNPLTVAA